METFIVFFKRTLSASEFSNLVKLLVDKRFFDYEDISAAEEDDEYRAVANQQELTRYLESTAKPVLQVSVDLDDTSWHDKKLWMIQEQEFHQQATEEYGYGLMFECWKFMRTCMLFSVDETPELEFVQKVAKQPCFAELLSILEEVTGNRLKINYGEE
jgi:hypothetical protein